MIKSHRRTHRQIWVMLALLLLSLYLLSIRARRHSIPTQKIAYETALTKPASPPLGYGSFPGGAWIFYIGEAPVLEIKTTEAFTAADPLVYWSPTDQELNPEAKEPLLLGALRGKGSFYFELPVETQESPGFVTIYAAASDETIAHWALWRQPGGIP